MSAGDCCCATARLSLTPKAFDILLILVQNRDRVIEKDELMKLVWPDTAVEENNLTRNIPACAGRLGNVPMNIDTS